MQSTGHSSMHALSLMSTQGSAMVYVTRCLSCPVGLPVSSRVSASWAPRSRRKYALPIPGRLSQCALTFRAAHEGGAWLLILDVAYTNQPVTTPGHSQPLAENVQQL